MSNGVVMTLEWIMESLTVSTCSPRCWCHNITVTNWQISHQHEICPILSLLPLECQCHTKALPFHSIFYYFFFIFYHSVLSFLFFTFTACQFRSMFVNILVMLRYFFFSSQETQPEENDFYLYKNADIVH